MQHNEKYQNDNVKLTVGLTGQCAALKILVGEELAKGSGWEFLKEQAGKEHSAFSGAEAKAVVKLRIWVVDGKAGLGLDATQLFLKAREKQVVEEEDAFDDDAQW